MKPFLVALFVAAGAADGRAAPAALALTPLAAPDVESILERLDDLYRSKSSVAKVELTVVKPGRTSTLRLRMETRGEEKALIVIEAPAREKGTATLKVERNLWNYLPRIDRTIRIPPSMMLSSWMGSDFTNDDLVRESSLKDDYDSRLVGPSTEPAGLLLELRAKPGAVGLWSRIEYVVTSDGALPLAARFYDRKDRLARILRFDELRTFSGRRLPSRMVLTPVEDGEPAAEQRTELRYLELDLDANVPESTFSLARLERGG